MSRCTSTASGIAEEDQQTHVIGVREIIIPCDLLGPRPSAQTIDFQKM